MSVMRRWVFSATPFALTARLISSYPERPVDAFAVWPRRSHHHATGPSITKCRCALFLIQIHFSHLRLGSGCVHSRVVEESRRCYFFVYRCRCCVPILAACIINTQAQEILRILSCVMQFWDVSMKFLTISKVRVHISARLRDDDVV